MSRIGRGQGFALRRRPAGALGVAPELDLPLPERVQVARDRLAHQDDPALLNVLSDREMAANRELAERVRAHERDERTARIEAAAKAADRVRRTIDDLADQQAVDLLRAEKAIAEQRHASSPHAKVARLHRRKTLMLRIITGVLVASLAVSAVSVQHNIAPTGGPTNVWWWMAYGIEFLISGTLIALVLSAGDTAEWDVIEEPWKAHAIEIVLLTVTVVLNTFPFFKNKEFFQIGVHAIAPIVIGVALLAHRVIAARYSQSIERATGALATADPRDLHARLAELTRIGGTGTATPLATMPAVEQIALPHPAVATPQLTAAPEQNSDSPRSSTPQFTPRTAGSDPAVAEPALDPAVRDDTRSSTPQFAPDIPSADGGLDSADPAVETSPTSENEVTAGAAVTPQFVVRQVPEMIEEAPDEMDVTAGSEEEPDSGNPQLVDRPTAGLRTVEQADTPQLRPRSFDPAVRGARTRTPQFTHNGSAGNSASKPAVRPHPMVNLATEIQQRGVGRRKSIDEMTTAVTAIVQGESNNAIAHATGMSHNTVNRIREAIDEIHAVDGVVIKLRKDSDR